MDSQDVPLREWLGERFDHVEERMTGIEELLIGNGHPGVLSRLRIHEERLRTQDTLLAYDRAQIDTLRMGTKKTALTFGGIASGIVSVLAAAALAVLEALNQR